VLLSSAWTIRSLLPQEECDALSEAVGPEALESAGRQVALTCIDELWADYLYNVAELKGGIHWVSWGGRDPLYEFLRGLESIYDDFHESLNEEVAKTFAEAEACNGQLQFRDVDLFKRGATWTYLTTDQPFGLLGDRILKGVLKRIKRRTSPVFFYRR
jgi:preprotein translocase subunit SecA